MVRCLFISVHIRLNNEAAIKDEFDDLFHLMKVQVSQSIDCHVIVGIGQLKNNYTFSRFQ